MGFQWYNVGEQNLNWQASAGNTSRLTLGNSSGTIKPGGHPQTIYMTANTSQLTPGYYSAALQINSNGGNAQVNTTLTATVPQPIPTPPTRVVSPKLRVNPTNFNANTDCSYAQDQGWYCVAILSSDASASNNLDWSASSSGINGVFFYPANGTLFPGPENMATARWRCSATPTPSPTSTDTSTPSSTDTSTLSPIDTSSPTSTDTSAPSPTDTSTPTVMDTPTSTDTSTM